MTMPSPHEPRPGKKTVGNRRTGYARNRHTAPGVHKGTLPWDKDPEILQRVAETGRRVAAGQPSREIAQALGVSEETTLEDRRRWRELARREPIGTIEESVERLRLIYLQALKAFASTKEASLNRSAYLSVARQATMDEAKLLGQEPRQRVEQEITLHNGDIDREIEELLGRERPGLRLAKPRLLVEGEGEMEGASAV